MLTRFSVSNFKGFNEEFIFDLQKTNGYAFNKECIKNGIVNNALVYGHNGVGKSNLGLAIFDIIKHLTDANNSPNYHSLNAFNRSETAKFTYEFLFDSSKISYEYEKTEQETIVSERLLINDKELAFFDRNSDEEARIYFKGAENLKKNLTNQNLSLLKYIKNNSELDDNEENRCFSKFSEFIEGMLFFRSLHGNMYLGRDRGTRDITEDVIENDNVEELESFFNQAGIECKLTVVRESEKDILAFDFNGKTISFNKIASSGTKALLLFYFWFKRLKEEKVSFLFIDEFDAFYHHELSALIVEELKKAGVQFILTSHNTSVITNDLLRPDCYFMMTNRSIRSLAKCTSKELREAHNIEKMYKAGSFNV